MPTVAEETLNDLLDAFGLAMLYTSIGCAIAAFYVWYKFQRTEDERTNT
jgi:hypothetical protein